MNIEANGEPYFPGAASLLDQLDKVILLILRDSRHLVGRLRSFDQFLNLILEDTFERVLIPGKFCDVPLGLYIVRGDNIVLLGEIDLEKEEQSNFIRISPEELTNFTENVQHQSNDKITWDFDI